jgi:hypothetical protein
MFARPGEAGQFTPPRAYFADDFLEGMYRAVPALGKSFDAVGLHPYTYYARELPSVVEETHRVLTRHGDGSKPLWIDEIGWSSEAPRRSDLFAKGPAGQAQQLRQAFATILRDRDRWHLAGVDWFAIEDEPDACNFCGGTGLFSAGFEPKPAWRAYAHLAGGKP